jgi:hypothetical protein
MSAHPRHRSTTRGIAAPRSRLVRVALAALLLVGLAGCGATFDPNSPCTTDGTAHNAYPDLEGVVPTAFKGAPPSDLDSGRACTAAGLGTLASHGVDELRFAGGTWEQGSDGGVSLAILTDPTGPALQPAWVAEFYEAGARLAPKVDSLEKSEYPVVNGVTARRIDVLNGESFQSIVVWERNGRIEVALVANSIRQIQTREAHDLIVRAAVDAFTG